MGTHCPLDSNEARRFARETAEDAHDHYYNGGEFSQRSINDVIAKLADGDAPKTDSHGIITTTQHNEKVILNWDYSQNVSELGSFGTELNAEALSVEQLDREERIDRLTEWILDTARRVRDDAEERASAYERGRALREDES